MIFHKYVAELVGTHIKIWHLITRCCWIKPLWFSSVSVLGCAVLNTETWFRYCLFSENQILISFINCTSVLYVIIFSFIDTNFFLILHFPFCFLFCCLQLKAFFFSLSWFLTFKALCCSLLQSLVTSWGLYSLLSVTHCWSLSLLFSFLFNPEVFFFFFEADRFIFLFSCLVFNF